MLGEKFLLGVSLMQEHGPLLIFASVLVIAGVQLLALGLLGEMQVRHYHEPEKGTPYTVDRILRNEKSEASRVED